MQVSGLAGQAQRFDGLDDTIWCGTGIDFNQDDFTWEILGKTGRSDREQIPLKVWSDPPVYGWLGSLEWPLDYNRNAFFGVRDDYASSIYRYLDPYNDSSDITDNEYHYLVGSLDRSLSIPPNMYQDGVLNNGYAEGNGDELGSDVGGGDTFLGSTGYYGYFQGDIDEVRISRIARSAAWIQAADYTFRDNLISFSAESEERGLGEEDYSEGGYGEAGEMGPLAGSFHSVQSIPAEAGIQHPFLLSSGISGRSEASQIGAASLSSSLIINQRPLPPNLPPHTMTY